MIAITLVAVLLASQSILEAHSSPVRQVGNRSPTPWLDQVGSLASLCSFKHGGPLTAEQVKLYAAQLAQGKQRDCPQNIMTSVMDMAKILEAHSNDVCTEGNMLAIMNFIETHNKPWMLMPGALQDFAFSYAFRSSHACKLAMLKLFTNMEENKLTPADFDALAKWTKKEAYIGRVLDKLSEPGTLLLPRDLALTMPDEDRIANLVRDISPDTIDEDVKHIRQVCESRFKPIYAPLVAPISTLAYAGLDYPDSNIIKEIKPNSKDVAVLDEWNRVVFLCETMDHVSAFKSTDGEPKSYEPMVHVRLEQVEPIPQQELTELRNFMGRHAAGKDRFLAYLAKVKARKGDSLGR